MSSDSGVLKPNSSFPTLNCILLYQGSMSSVRKKLMPKWDEVIQTKVLIQRSLCKKQWLPNFTVRASIFAYHALLPAPPLLLAWVKLFICLPLANYIVSRSQFNAPFHIISSRYIVKSGKASIQANFIWGPVALRM